MCLNVDSQQVTSVLFNRLRKQSYNAAVKPYVLQHNQFIYFHSGFQIVVRQLHGCKILQVIHENLSTGIQMVDEAMEE